MDRRQKTSSLYEPYDYIVILTREDYSRLSYIAALSGNEMLTGLVTKLKVENGVVYGGEVRRYIFCLSIVYIAKNYPGGALVENLKNLGRLQDLYFQENLEKAALEYDVLEQQTTSPEPTPQAP